MACYFHLHLICHQPCKRGLTTRSSGAPTAGHQARSGGTRYIFASPGLASCRRRPLSSNVRPHKLHHHAVHQKHVPQLRRQSWANHLARLELIPSFASEMQFLRSELLSVRPIAAFYCRTTCSSQLRTFRRSKLGVYNFLCCICTFCNGGIHQPMQVTDLGSEIRLTVKIPSPNHANAIGQSNPNAA